MTSSTSIVAVALDLLIAPRISEHWPNTPVVHELMTDTPPPEGVRIASTVTPATGAPALVTSTRHCAVHDVCPALSQATAEETIATWFSSDTVVPVVDGRVVELVEVELVDVDEVELVETTTPSPEVTSKASA